MFRNTGALTFSCCDSGASVWPAADTGAPVCVESCLEADADGGDEEPVGAEQGLALAVVL